MCDPRQQHSVVSLNSTMPIAVHLRIGCALLLSPPAGTILSGDVRIWRADPTRFAAIEAHEGVFWFRNELYVTRHGYSITASLAVRRADLETICPFAGIQFAENMPLDQPALNTEYPI
jgi:hypothetical protein